MIGFLREWKQDGLLRGIVKSSSYLFSSNALAAGLSFLQGIFAIRLVGMEGLGLVTTVVTFASNTNRLFSFRMSEVVVKHLGQALAEGKKERAAAVAKGIALVEALTSVLAYLVLLALSPWAARILAKKPDTVALFTFYGLVLLANLVFETSTGILQSTRRFDRLAAINTIQSVITASAIFLAFLFQRGVWEVLLAYLLGKAFVGLAVAVSAFSQLSLTLGRGWWRVRLSLLSDWRSLFGFAINTNLNGTVNLVVRDSIPLFLAALRSSTEVGYFKLALTIINLVMLPVEPFIWPTYAEITNTIAGRQWQVTRRLLRRVSAIAALWTLAAGTGIALFGWWLIPLVYKPESAPAYPAVLILLVGYGFANIFNWNRPLLLALGMPGFPLMVAILVGVVEVALTFWLVPLHGYLAQAVILSGFFLVSVGVIVWRGLNEISRRSLLEVT